MPLLTYPLALIGLVAVPGLVTIYLLRRRFQRRDVTGLFLWTTLTQAEQGGRRVERFRMPLLFLIELLALLALALAATDPRLLASRPVRPMILILDDSYSMRAEGGGMDARERALEGIREEMAGYEPTVVRVIIAGEVPRLAGPPMSAEQALGVAETRWTCLAPEANLVAAQTLASEVGEKAWVLVATDHPPLDEDAVDGRVRWVCGGAAAPNASFIAAGRSHAGNERDRCFLQVANPGTLPVATMLTVTADGVDLGVGRPLTLAAGTSEQIAFEIPSAVKRLRASLAEDALATDNEALLLAPRERRVRVANSVADTELRGLVARALAASNLRAPDTGRPDLVIADGPAGTPSPQRWTLEIRKPDGAIPFTGPFVGDWGHPLLQGLDFSGVVWAGKQGREPEGLPVLMAGNTSLLEDRELHGGHSVRMYLDAEQSTVGRTPNWPALFWNLLRWRAEHHPGFLEAQVRLGNTARLLLPPAETGERARTIRVETPDGTTQEQDWPMADELAVAATVPGVYSARVGDHVYRFACNALSPAEGDLSLCRSARLGGRMESDVVRREYASGAWLFGLLCSLLLLLHLFLLRSRSVGSSSAG
jgi:hypothetical protein